MHSRRILGLATMALALVTLAAPARAQVSWAVAEREDAQIQSLVSKLEPFVEKLPGQKDADAVILFNQVQTRVESSELAEMCRNLLLEVRDPSALAEQLTSPWVAPDMEVTMVAAFVLRDGKVRRIAEDSATFEEGDAGYGRGRCQIEWGEVKKGDVIGWSWIATLDENLPAYTFAVADVYPCVISNLTIDGGGQFLYDFDPVGFDRKELSLKKSELKEGEPSLFKASVNARAAVKSLPLSGPYPDSVPHVAVSLRAVWIEPEGGPIPPQWLPFGGWNDTVTSLAGMLQQRARDESVSSILLSTMTTGKTTDEEKIQAVFEHVQQKVELLEGPGVNRLGMREENLMSAKSATAAEKVLMMGVLLSELEIPASLALIKTPDFGELDPKRESWTQFNEFALHTGEMGSGSFWVPQCGDCIPGALPAGWSGGTALVAPENLLDLAEQFGESKRMDIFNGKISLREMRKEQNEQPWHELVSLGD